MAFSYNENMKLFFLFPQDTFERKSHKYWVALQDVFQFKVKVVKHLPLHFFARKKRMRDSTLVQDLLMEVWLCKLIRKMIY